MYTPIADEETDDTVNDEDEDAATAMAAMVVEVMAVAVAAALEVVAAAGTFDMSWPAERLATVTRKIWRRVIFNLDVCLSRESLLVQGGLRLEGTNVARVDQSS